MSDETPILRADALDDDLQECPKFARGGIIENSPGPHNDAIPVFLGCDYVIPKSAVTEEFKQMVRQHMDENAELMQRLALVDTAENGEFVVGGGSNVVAWEPYENGSGGWSYRPIFARND